MLYKGTHKGKVFDESKGKGFTFRLGEEPLLGVGAIACCALSVTLLPRVAVIRMTQSMQPETSPDTGMLRRSGVGEVIKCTPSSVTPVQPAAPSHAHQRYLQHPCSTPLLNSCIPACIWLLAGSIIV